MYDDPARRWILLVAPWALLFVESPVAALEAVGQMHGLSGTVTRNAGRRRRLAERIGLW